MFGTGEAKPSRVTRLPLVGRHHLSSDPAAREMFAECGATPASGHSEAAEASIRA